MAAGWLYSAVMAAFPLVGIGSYSKTRSVKNKLHSYITLSLTKTWVQILGRPLRASVPDLDRVPAHDLGGDPASDLSVTGHHAAATSICLPVVRDDQDRAGIAFLLFLLLGNCLAFLLISWFYLRMYCSISTVERGLVRPNDLKVGTRAWRGGGVNTEWEGGGVQGLH